LTDGKRGAKRELRGARRRIRVLKGDFLAWAGFEGTQGLSNFNSEERKMTKKNMVLGSALSAVLFFAGVAVAQHPAQNVSGERHPNLAAAQRLTNMAFNKITAAQEANEWDMEGHAAKAKDLLDQANHELKLAAEAANKK
jgi:hypothetical protein